MLTDDFHNHDFIKIIMEITSLPLRILIWGSGAKKKHYSKRKKVREKIERKFPNAKVFFSEDEELNELLHRNIPGSEDWDISEKEPWHLHFCHVCIALDTNEGVSAEIAQMLKTRDGYKIFILTHIKYKNKKSYKAAVRKAGNQVFYTQKEYDECNLGDRAIGQVIKAGFNEKYGKISRF